MTTTILYIQGVSEEIHYTQGMHRFDLRVVIRTCTVLRSHVGLWWSNTSLDLVNKFALKGLF